MALKLEIKKELKATTTKKYCGVYAMGDAPIVVRGLIKALEMFDLDGQIEGVNPRNGGERLAVVLALFLKEVNPNGIDVKELSKVMRTLEGARVPSLEGRGGATWEELAINEIVANFVAPTSTDTTKKNKKK